MKLVARICTTLSSLYRKIMHHFESPNDSSSAIKKEYPRILFVLKYREGYDPYTHTSAGGDWGDGAPKRPLSSGLFNSARMVTEMLVQHGVPAKIVHVIDNNSIHRELVEFKADIVVIEAFWVVPEKFDELYRVCPNVTFIIRNHSEVPFLAQEGIAFDWMMRYINKPNVIMSANSERMNRETRELARIANPDVDIMEIVRKTPYLPNYYQIPEPKDARSIDPESEFIDIGCFGAVRPLKNQLLQAIAAIEFANNIGKRLRFHINGKRIEMNGGQVIKNLVALFSHYSDYELVNHAWMPHHEFKELIASMDIVMQVSFSETFNIVAADAISQGVLTITSPEIYWSSPQLQADPTSSTSILDTLYAGWMRKVENPEWNPNLAGLEKYNEKSVGVWLHYLANFRKPKK
jgi:hypothetical protein